MKKKCYICNQGKAGRFCAAVSEDICSFCCGSKRQKEIECFSACEYLKQGQEYQLSRQISHEINSSFQTEAEDIFQNEDDAIRFVGPIEKLFVKKFYNDKNTNDDNIYDALIRIYAYQTGRIETLSAENECEETIFKIFKKIDKEFPDIPGNIKTGSILRILKSIKNSSGGALGNRNYLEMIYSQFNKDGRWSHMFKMIK